MQLSSPLIISGPSGVGKSTFGQYLESQDWMYLEADLTDADGIDVLGLRNPWDAFWEKYDARPLSSELTERKNKEGKAGVVLSLPSCAIPSPAHLIKSQDLMSIRFLYGAPSYCLAAFLSRESGSGRGLDEAHWKQNNERVFSTLCNTEYIPYRINVFETDGGRIPWETVLSAITSGM